MEGDGLGQLLSSGALTPTVPPGSGIRDVVYIARIVEVRPPFKVQAHGGVRPSPRQAHCSPVPVDFQDNPWKSSGENLGMALG